MGGSHVLEATIVAILMVSAMAFVATYEQPADVSNRIGELLDQKVWDFLYTANEMTLTGNPCVADTVLLQMIAEGVSGNDSTWRRRTNHLLGPGLDTSMSLWNGRGRLPLHDGYDPRGSADTIAIQPDFHYVKVIGDSATTGAGDFLVENALAVKRGELVSTKGDALSVQVKWSDPLGSQSRTTWGAIALGPADRGGVMNVTPVARGRGEITSVFEAAGPASEEVRLKFKAAGIPSPANGGARPGTTVTAQIPAGWRFTEAGGPGWPLTHLSGTNETGWTLRFVATESVTNDDLIEIFATPPSSVDRPFDVIPVHLSNGSFGQTHLVVQYPVSVQRDLPRTIYPTIPYPVVPGTRAIFGVAFANGGEDAVVSQIDFEVPGGYDLTHNGGRGAALFGEGEILPLGDTPLPPAFDPDGEGGAEPITIDPWTRIDGRHIQWRGNVKVPAGRAQSFLFSVPITSDASQATAIEPVNGLGVRSSLAFDNGFVSESATWGQAPGVLVHEARPATNGSSSDGYSSDDAVESMRAGVVGSRINMTTEASVQVTLAADATRLHSALANSSFAVSKRLVPLGGYAYADADLRGLSTELAVRGVREPVVNVSLFAPPSLGCVPTHRWVMDSSDLPRAGITAIATAELPGVGASSLFVGAEDGRVHRVEPTGAPMWSRGVGSVPTRLVMIDAGATGAVLVGDAGGSVARLDALDGREVWRVSVSSEHPGTSGSMGVSALAVDAVRGRIVAATGNGGLALMDLDGRLLARVSAQVSVGSSGYGAAAFAADGRVLAGNASHAEKLEARDGGTLQELGSASGEVRAIAFAGDRILVAETSIVGVLDAATLAPLRAHTASGVIARAWVADVDGDGMDDLLLGMTDATLKKMDGESEFITQFQPPFTLTGKRPALQLAPLGRRECVEGVSDGSIGVLRYGQGTCYVDPSLVPSMPLALAAENGRIAYAYQYDNRVSFAALDADLRVLSIDGITARGTPTTIALASLGGADAYVVGYDDGLLETRSIATGQVLQTSSVTEFAGRFTIGFRVPLGAFFGTHVLVARMEWVDATGESRTASLVDWFEVVDVDGLPVAAPHYRVEVSAADHSLRMS